MARATFYNKRLLGHIDDTDFTDYQGIGSDPLYKRYKSVESVVKSRIHNISLYLLALFMKMAIFSGMLTNGIIRLKNSPNFQMQKRNIIPTSRMIL